MAGQSTQPYKIFGVIRDMVMESPYEPVEPTLFFGIALNGGVSRMNIRLKPGVATSQALPKIEAVFKKDSPAVPFDYKFVDQEYALKFAAEERIGKLAGFFAVLAIFISCLGLFGLGFFCCRTAHKGNWCTKVLGASVFNLWSLLSKDFVMLVFFLFLSLLLSPIILCRAGFRIIIPH